MQINNLIPKTKNKKTMIVARGGKRGKTAGRGGKGQTARAGNKRRPELRDFIKRLPKLRGRGVNPHKSISERPMIVNLGSLENVAKDGALITPKTLVEMGLLSTFEGKIPNVKILSLGEITKKVSVEGCEISKEAITKIEKAGGSVKK